MKLIKLTCIEKFGSIAKLSINPFDIKYLKEVNELTVIKLTDYEFTVSESIDEIIELIEAPNNALMKIIEKMTSNDDNAGHFDLNLN